VRASLSSGTKWHWEQAQREDTQNGAKEREMAAFCQGRMERPMMDARRSATKERKSRRSKKITWRSTVSDSQGCLLEK
jgi:hypothetical protein